MRILYFISMFMVLCTSADAETYIFVSGEFPFLSEKTEDGNFRGIAVDIARIITERLGHTAAINLYPWLRAQYLVKCGNADVLMPPYKTREREKWLDYTEIPFAPDKSFLFVRPDSKLVWNGDFSSIKGRMIGMAKGWSVGPDFEKAKNYLSIDYALTLELCFKKLLAKRVDMVPAQLREANASFKRLGLTYEQKPKPIFPELAINYNYFGFSKQKQKELLVFRKNFNRELKKMRANGEIAKILSEYGILEED